MDKMRRESLKTAKIPERMAEWLIGLDVWYGVGMIGGATSGAFLAVTGTDVGQIDPRFKWVWVILLAFFGSIVQFVRTMEQKQLKRLGIDPVE